MKKAVLLGFLLSGCATHPQELPLQSLTPYVSCNLAASQAVAPQSGDPTSLAIAARGLCANEELELLAEIKATRGDSPQTYRLLEAYKQAAARSNTTEIVRARGRAQPR